MGNRLWRLSEQGTMERHEKKSVFIIAHQFHSNHSRYEKSFDTTGTNESIICKPIKTAFHSETIAHFQASISRDWDTVCLSNGDRYWLHGSEACITDYSFSLSSSVYTHLCFGYPRSTVHVSSITYVHLDLWSIIDCSAQPAPVLVNSTGKRK
jgi:hypothetical protein